MLWLVQGLIREQGADDWLLLFLRMLILFRRAHVISMMHLLIYLATSDIPFLTFSKIMVLATFVFCLFSDFVLVHHRGIVLQDGSWATHFRPHVCLNSYLSHCSGIFIVISEVCWSCIHRILVDDVKKLVVFIDLGIITPLALLTFD